MIYEFALDPGVLSTWGSFRYFYDNFGAEHGRLISQFPKRWKRMVYDACSKCDDIEKKKIEERLTDINSKLIRMSREYNNSMPWLENAEEQHIADPFRAIISDSNPRNISEILIAADLDNTDPLWNVMRGECIPRDASDMAKCVLPMLQLCSVVLFVDPHFNSSELRYRNTLQQFVKSTSKNPKILRMEYHLGDKIEKSHFESECKNKLPCLLPKGLEIIFLRWRQLEEGEKLHPRYILTDIGGIRIEVGLDEGEIGETTDISLLSKLEYSQRWGNYQRGTAAYKLVDELKIVGE